MQDKIIKTTIIAFLTLSIFVFLNGVNLTGVIDVAMADNSGKEFKGTPKRTVVNYYTGKPLSSRSLITHNKMIQASYGDEEFKLRPTKDVAVCVIDSFRNSDDFDVRGSHGENVTKLINKRYNGDVYQFDVSHTSYRNYDFAECDVINYSLAIQEENRSSNVFKNISKFMKKYKGVLVVAAGNDGDTVTKSEWSAYLESNGNQDWSNRVLIVAQGVLTYNENRELEKQNYTSYGEEIDMIVFNTDEHIKNYAVNGSSYAAPIVTSAVANYLSLGVPTEQVKELLIQSAGVFEDQYGYSYSDFRVDESNKGLIRYLNKENISFNYKE